MTMHASTTVTGRPSFTELCGPMLRALLWGVIGYTAGALVTAWTEGSPVSSDRPVAVGFCVGLMGWLLGGGAWEAWVKPWFGAPDTWDEGTGVARYLRYNTDHKVIGIQYLGAAGLTFIVAGLLALLMRLELLTPELNVFATNKAYNVTFGVHGTLMLFAVAVVAIVGGFGNYFVPLMVGAEDMTYPYVNGFSWWFVPPGVAAIALSPLVGGFQTGWTGYAPLAAMNDTGQVLYYLGIISLGISSLFTAINVIATTLYMRAPGLTWGRLPVFVWAMLATAVLNVLWIPVVGVGMIMGLFDRVIPTQFFGQGGLPLVWQDIFWLFGHPEVYIIIFGAWGLWLEILPVMTRKTLFGYRWAIAGFLGVMFLSSYVWTHHMFTTTADVRLIPFMTTTELISIPTGFMYLCALATLWKGRIRLNTPMLIVLMGMFNFLIGGLSGVFLADVPANFQLHNTYFVVSHFHYTILGGMVFGWFAGMYYWFPKFSGRMYNEFWGKVNAWWMLVFFNLTFFPMFLNGIEGMNRRVGVYLDYLQGQNVFISSMAFLLGLGFLIPLLNFTLSWAYGPAAAANPWGGKTLEWQTSSPPPHHNFERIPVVTSDFYGYGDAPPEPDLFPAPAPAAPRNVGGQA